MVNQSNRINELLSTPEKMVADDLMHLDQALSAYPWFQAVRSVYLKGLHNESSSLYNNALQITATHTADRAVLFDFITSPVFKQNRISEHIKKQQEYLHELPVEIENPVVKEEDLNSAVDFNNTLDKDLFKRSVEEITSQPLDFDTSENYSFSEWLKLTTLKPIQRENETDPLKENVTLDPQRAEKMAIIDQFLAEKPKITPKKVKENTVNLAASHNPPHQLMTETLAQVYLAQKNYSKAIQAYEILVLHHPEKSGFFADRIREIKNLQSNI